MTLALLALPGAGLCAALAAVLAMTGYRRTLRDRLAVRARIAALREEAA